MVCGANLLLKIKNNIVKLLFRGENAMAMHSKELLMCTANVMKSVTSDLCDAHKNDASGSFSVLPHVLKDLCASQNFSGGVLAVGCVGSSGRLA